MGYGLAMSLGSETLNTALARLAIIVRPSLRGRVFALLAGLTLCACAGATATYWLARHYLDATDILRQVNLSQQVSAARLSGQLWALESEAQAVRQAAAGPDSSGRVSARRARFEEIRQRVDREVVVAHAGEPLEAGRELLDRMHGLLADQVAALRAHMEAPPGGREAGQALERAANHRQAAQEAAAELLALHGRDADLGVQSMRSLARVATTGSLLAIPMGAVLGLLLAWVLLRQVLGPIRRLALGAALASASEAATEHGAAPSEALPAAVPAASPVVAGSDEVRAVAELVQSLLRDVDQTQALLAASRQHLIQAEKLALVGKLAAGVAHSVRNPLTSVKMRLFSLEKSLDLSPMQREDFDVISEEIRHLDTIVRNFLEFSRPPKPKFQHVSPSDVVDMTLQLLKHRLETYGVEVRLVRERALPEVDVDPEQLKEALVNLILNACDAMGENGRIEILEQTGFMDPLGRVAILQLTDSGPGIPPDIAGQVFQPFFSTKEEGTGLGLAIAQRIMEEHGGYIHLKPQAQAQAGEPGEPEARRGASFLLVLPIREKVWLRS